MARVICPFCLQPHETGVAPRFKCPRSNEVLPAAYIEQYERVPPLWLATVGFAEHGKTTYLAALTLTLDHISNLWPKSYCRSLDQYTLEARRGWMRAARLGERHGATSVRAPRPLLINVTDLPERGNRCLVMYDVAGEIYQRLEEEDGYLAALRYVSTTWFFVSLDDLDAQDHTLSELFTVYLAGLENMRADLTDRNLIVVYTKGDRLQHPAIRAYLQDDPLQRLTHPDGMGGAPGGFNLTDYYSAMEAMSETLREHTLRRVPGGRAFVNMVESHGMRLTFSVTSALGGDPDRGAELREDVRRFRILDPFLWAVRLERPLTTRQLTLIVDASDSQGVAGEAVVGELWAQLNSAGDVTSYRLGAERSIALPGQKPALGKLGPPRPRLAGPILERLPATGRAIIVSAGPVLDLEDYQGGPWQERLLLVGLEEAPAQEWKHTLVYRADEGTSALVAALLKLPA